MSRQELPFDVLHDGIAFPIEEGREYAPLIVIAQPAQAAELEFSEALWPYLDEVDFNRSLILLAARATQPDSAVVEKVIRTGAHISIHLSPVGDLLGSYVLPDFTRPYQIIRVAKTGAWNADFTFTLEGDDGGVLFEAAVFVP